MATIRETRSDGRTVVRKNVSALEKAYTDLQAETGGKASIFDAFAKVREDARLEAINKALSGDTDALARLTGTADKVADPTNDYKAENGVTYSTTNPLGPEEIIKRYTEVLNSEPTGAESERTKAAYERLQGYNDNRPEYQKSDAVNEALDRLREAESAKPGEYSSLYQADIDAILDSLNNREGFSYDPGEDQLYKTYRDQYLRLGQRAMQDTMGNAAALGGGYGSSYAQRAGQQAYQDYLAGMNDAVNTMYGQAYQRYQDEGNELYNRLNTLQGLENEAYERYRDQLNDYLTERAYANTNYTNERATDYDRYRDTVGDWETDRAYWNNLYNTERANDQTDYANQLAQWEADRDFWTQLMETVRAHGGSGGGSSLLEMAALMEEPVATESPYKGFASPTVFLGNGTSRTATGGTVSDGVKAAHYTGNTASGSTPKTTSMVGTGWSEDQLKKYGEALGLTDVQNNSSNVIRGGTWSDAAYNAYLAQHPVTAAQQQQAATVADLIKAANKYGVR